jgi:hypothetical protein
MAAPLLVDETTDSRAAFVCAILVKIGMLAVGEVIEKRRPKPEERESRKMQIGILD